MLDKTVVTVKELQSLLDKTVVTVRELQSLLGKTVVTVRELQSLLGKLHFVSLCVRPGRLFVSRLLTWLRSLPDDKEYYNIPLFAKKDLIWRSKFFEYF